MGVGEDAHKTQPILILNPSPCGRRGRGVGVGGRVGRGETERERESREVL